MFKAILGGVCMVVGDVAIFAGGICASVAVEVFGGSSAPIEANISNAIETYNEWIEDKFE